MAQHKVTVGGREWEVEVSRGNTLVDPATFQLEIPLRILVRTDAEGITKMSQTKLREDLASAVEKAIKKLV